MNVIVILMNAGKVATIVGIQKDVGKMNADMMIWTVGKLTKIVGNTLNHVLMLAHLSPIQVKDADCWNTGNDPHGAGHGLFKISEHGDGTDEEHEFECMDECADVMEAAEHYDWETCGNCFWSTCVEECEHCDWEDEHDPCWDGCLACWDPAGCAELSDWGEDEEWATEVCAMTCWVHTNPCNMDCAGLPIPSEGCLNCLDDNGYMGSTHFAPIMAKNFVSINFVKASEGGDGHDAEQHGDGTDGDH